MTPYVFFFPWTCREQEKKKHLSLAFLLSLFLSFLKPKKLTKHPTCPNLDPWPTTR